MVHYVDSFNFKPTMLGQQISEVLKQAIVANKIKCGEHLLELQLQKKFGVSRSPLREAFQALRRIGLVEIIPNKGTFVKSITEEEIRENYEVRAPLEGVAARKAYRLMTGEDHLALNEILEKMTLAAKEKRVLDYWEHHAIFHEIFIRASGNKLLIGTIEMLRIHSKRHRNAFPNFNEALTISAEIHDEIYNKFISSNIDEKKFAYFVEKHVEDALSPFLSNIKQPT